MSVARWPNGMPKVAWICEGCAADLGAGQMHLATFHAGSCGVCRKTKTVTEPRDYVWTGCAGGNCD